MLNYKAPGVYIEEEPTVAPIAGVGTSTAAFIGLYPDPPSIPATPSTPTTPGTPGWDPVAAKVVVPCTNFTEFADKFGGFSTVAAQNRFAHAVRGFFTNGGTFCYVVRVTQEPDV